MTTTVAENQCITKEEYHRLRDDQPTNGAAPSNGNVPERRACETCAGSLSSSQTRFCSKPCAARGVSRDRKLAKEEALLAAEESDDSENLAAPEIGPLVAQLLAVVQVGEVEMQFSGVRVLVRTRPEGVRDAG